MRNPTAAFTAVLVFLSVSLPVRGLEITHTEIGPGGRLQFLLKNDKTIDLVDARSLVTLAARAACPGRSLALGEFSVLPADAAGTFQYTHQINCNIGFAGILPAPPPFPPTFPLSEERRQEIAERVRSATEAHIRLIADGQLDVASRNLNTLDQSWNRERWKFDRQGFRLIAGPLDEVVVSGASVGPHQLEGQPTRIYAQVWFRATYRDVAMECGTLIWHQIGEDEFRIAIERLGYITREHLATIPKEDEPLVYRWLECRL